MIEVKEVGGSLSFIVDGVEVAPTPNMRDNVPYIVLKVLVRQQGGRLMFSDIYEMVDALQKYVRRETAVRFVNEVFPEDAIPEELREFYALTSAKPKPVPRSRFSLVPKDVLDAVDGVFDMLVFDRGYAVDETEFLKLLGVKEAILRDCIELAKPILVPTVLGFTTVDKATICYNSGDAEHVIYVPLGNSSWKLYISHPSLGDLITLTQIINNLGNNGEGNFLTGFARSAPPIPSELVTPSVTSEATAEPEVGVLHRLLGDLVGHRLVLPVLEPNGVAWREARVVSEKIAKRSIRVYYRSGGYTGKVVFVPANNKRDYIEAMRKLLGMNKWLVERMRQNTASLLQFLRRYMEYLTEFKSYAKILLQ